MRTNRKIARRLLGLGLLLGAYPAFVLCYTWSCVLCSDFQGGRHGPLDAYRHALASSVVSYTLGEPAVALVTQLFESKGKKSNAMDGHNNRIGARIGSQAQAFHELETMVRHAVLNGATNAAETNQITWLPENMWRNGWIW